MAVHLCHMPDQATFYCETPDVVRLEADVGTGLQQGSPELCLLDSLAVSLKCTHVWLSESLCSPAQNEIISQGRQRLCMDTQYTMHFKGNIRCPSSSIEISAASFSGSRAACFLGYSVGLCCCGHLQYEGSWKFRGEERSPLFQKCPCGSLPYLVPVKSLSVWEL